MKASPSRDVTSEVRGQPKRRSRNNLRRNVGKVILYVWLSKHVSGSRNVFCTLNRRYVQLGVFLFYACLPVRYFTVYAVLGSLMSKLQRQRVELLCKRTLYFFIHFFAILSETTMWNGHILNIRENVKHGGLSLKFLFRVLTLSYIFCLG